MSRSVVTVVRKANLVGAACAAACLLISAGAHGRAVVGKPAPWFKLQSLNGRTFTRQQIKGRPALLVVGRTQRAAPPCKKWVLRVIKRRGASLPVYQVIVVDKAWYIPRGAVIKRIKGFSPRRWHHRVLVEWYTVFADTWGVSKHDEPVLFLLDRRGVVRFRHRGPVTTRALSRLEAALKRFR